MKVPDFPEPPASVFMLASPNHMLGKLAWEITELGKSLGFEKNRFPKRHPAYHAYNCAITAWHLCDWTWQACNSDQREFLANKYDLSNVSDDRKFEKFCDAISDECQELQICRQIANGSKHMKLRRTATVKASAEWVRVSEPAGQLRPGDLMMDLRVTDGEKEITADWLFTRAFSFWEGLLCELGFAEGRYVPSEPC
jgi:hypothetical protein